MNNLNIKFVEQNGITYNFDAEIEQSIKTAFSEINVNRPWAGKEWADKISDVDFLERCIKQPDEKSIYVASGSTLDEIREIFKSKDVASVKQLAQNIAAKFDVELSQVKDEVEQLKEDGLVDFKKDLERNNISEIKPQDLNRWIKDSSIELLDNILAYFKNQEGLNCAGLSAKRKKVVELVVDNDDKEIAALLKLNSVNCTGSFNEFSSTKKEYDAARESLVEKRQAYDAAKQKFENSLAYCSDLSGMLFVDNNPEALKMLENSKRASNLARAKKKMQSIKREGLIAVSRGFAIAAIEGKEEAYMATVVEIGNKVIAATKGAINSHPSQDIIPQSEEQYDAVLGTINPIVKDEIKVYSGEKGTDIGTGVNANSLSVKNKTNSKQPNSQKQGSK